MANLVEVIAYFCKYYPHKSELSKARLTKMVYLADWRSAIVRGRQLTDLEWVFNHFGPYLDDVVEKARESEQFVVVKSTNSFGFPKEVVSLVSHPQIAIATEDATILDHVIENTKDLNWKEFIRLVYSTYPIVSQSRYEVLDLVALAKEYQGVEHLLN